MATSLARILVIEDDASIVLLITRQLTHLGYEVAAIAASGVEAIRLALETQPDLALVDIKLEGDQDGIETAAHLRASLNLPMIYLTAYADAETLRRAKETQPDGYLIKPFQEINLQIAIEMALYRHKIQQALRDSEERWRAVIEQSQDGIMLMDEHGLVVEWNKGQEQITGRTRAEVIGQPLWDVQYQMMLAERRRAPGMYEQLKAGIEIFLQTGDAPWLNHPLEYEIQRADGTRRFTQTIAFAIKTSQGVMAASIIRDITARKQAEEQAQAAERFTRATIDALSAHICVLDETGVILAVNRAWREFAQANPPAPANCGEGANYLSVCNLAGGPDAAEAAPFAAGIRAVMRGELEQFDLEYPCHSPQEPRWFIGRVTRFPSAGSLRLVVAHENITARKQVEETLRASEERYRLITENTNDTIWLMDMNLRHTFISPSVERTRGYTLAELQAQSIEQRLTPDSLKIALSVLSQELIPEKLVQSDLTISRTLELEFYRKDSSTIWEEVTFTLIRDDTGQPTAILSVGHDITERKHAAQILAQRAAQLTIINDIGRQITTTLKLDTVLEQAARLVQTRFDYHHVALFLVEGDALKLKAVAGAYTAYFPPGHTQPLNQGLNGWVATHGEKIVANDVRAEARYTSLIAEYTITRAELSLPIKIGPDTVGVLDIQSPALNAFADNDVLAMETLTGQIAVAIVNSRLYEAAQQELVERQRAEQILQTNLQQTKIAYDQATIYAQQLVQEVKERKQAQADLSAERALLARRIEERTAELSAAVAELERAARLKDEFLANMSHELRTPLNSILGMAEILKENVYGELNAEQQQSVGYIEESGRHLLALITDILDLAKIEAGKTELLLTPVAASDVCQASLLFIKQLALKKQLQVQYTNDDNIEAIQVDERRLKQILVNLLSNAAKFTPEGGQIGLEVKGDRAREVVSFTVWDTGIGIASADMARLFKPFSQIDSSLARQYEGTGLGLSLVYRLTEMHGGSVTMESEGAPGRGCRFTVVLPWPASNQEASLAGDKLPQVKLPMVDGASPPVRVILLAEDNEANIATIQPFLQAKEYRVIVAHNGIEAIEQAWDVRPDLILMDIQMPGMDGLEAIRHLRTDIRLNTTPIIALTALAMPGDRERCLAVGANEYLSKPVSLKKLTQLIDKLIEAAKAQ